VLERDDKLLNFSFIDKLKQIESKDELAEYLHKIILYKDIKESIKLFAEWVLNFYENLCKVKYVIGDHHEMSPNETLEIKDELRNRVDKFITQQVETSEEKHILAEKSRSIMLKKMAKMKNKFLKINQMNISDDENVSAKDTKEPDSSVIKKEDDPKP
jgi:hypothetical protein